MVWFIIGLFLFLGLFSGFFFLWKIPGINIITEGKDMPSISIVIPARNEESSLPHLLRSIKKQSLQPLEVIVVDDDSSDETAQIAESFNATVLSTKSVNRSEKGKSSACWIGAEKAEGDWLLFLDADTYFVHNHALESIAAVYYEKNDHSLFSIQPYHGISQFYETFSVCLNIMVMAGLNRFSLLKDKLPTRGAFGPFLLTSRKSYDKVGGHFSILDSHMDDIELARLYKKSGIPVHVYGGASAVHFRMFPDGISQFVNGWTKSLLHGAEGTHPLVIISIGLWITGHFLAFFTLILSLIQMSTLPILLALGIYVIYCTQFRWLMNKVGKFPYWVSCVPFIYLTAFILLYGWAFIQVKVLKKVKWRDREIKT